MNPKCDTPNKPMYLSRLISVLPGASCLKLTTSLVNVSLNFKRKYYKYAVIKDSHIFPTKSNSVFDNVVSIYLTS